AVVCSTDEQRLLIEPLCANTHLILDFQDDDVLLRKTDYAAGGAIKVMWEGLASSGIPLQRLREILDPLSRRRPLSLQLVTDPVTDRYSTVYGRAPVAAAVKREPGPLAERAGIDAWSSETLSRVAAAADLALIPIDPTDRFAVGKPENKLLLLWRLGVPTLAS